MNVRAIQNSIVYLLAAGCLASCGSSNIFIKRPKTFAIINPSTVERTDELVVLSRQVVEQKLGGALGKRFVQLLDKDKQSVPLQFDDLDDDGVWDEVVFLVDLEPGDTSRYTISATTTAGMQQAARAHVRMRKKNADDSFGPLLDSVTVPGNTPNTDFTKQKLPPFLTEGPAWENDKVAFRIYMDTRNIKDIFGKRTTGMVLDTIGSNPARSYHQLASWGMDILAVGRSLGAGSLALRVPLAGGKDTLVRLGGANVESITYKAIADGPLRGVLRLHYKNWQVAANLPPVNVTEEISIWGGKYYYESKVTVQNAPAGAELVTGIVNLRSKKLNEISVGTSRVFYTYDAQSDTKDMLGLAVMVHKDQFLRSGQTPNSGSDILNTYTISMSLTTQPVVFRFFAGWEMSDLLFVREESFRKYLEYVAEKWQQPLVVKFR